MPRVSILINNYNNDPWLRACVDSALSQTRPADEIIVFDDGSTDDSLAILRGYGDRIRLIDGGRRPKPISIVCQAEAITRAFNESSGDYILLLDGDDCYLPRRVELALRAWDSRPEASLVQGPHRDIDEEGRELRECRQPRPPGDRYLEAIHRSHSVDWFYPTSTQAFRRDFLTRHLPLQMPGHLDSALDMRLAYLATLSPGGVTAHDKIANLYRRRRGSMSETTGLSGLNRAEFIRMQVACFNTYALAAGQPRIRLWRNRNYLLNTVRHRLPFGLGEWLATRMADSARRRDTPPTGGAR